MKPPLLSLGTCIPALLAACVVAALPAQSQGMPQNETVQAVEQHTNAPGIHNRTSILPEESVSSLFSADPIFMDGVSSFQTLDDRAFTLERRGRQTLFKFADDREVWSLESVPGPRGDEFLKNDTGRLFVRLTDLGGAILFDAAHPDGLPVDPIASGPAITLPP